MTKSLKYVCEVSFFQGSLSDPCSCKGLPAKSAQKAQCTDFRIPIFDWGHRRTTVNQLGKMPQKRPFRLIVRPMGYDNLTKNRTRLAKGWAEITGTLRESDPGQLGIPHACRRWLIRHDFYLVTRLAAIQAQSEARIRIHLRSLRKSSRVPITDNMCRECNLFNVRKEVC